LVIKVPTIKGIVDVGLDGIPVSFFSSSFNRCQLIVVGLQLGSVSVPGGGVVGWAHLSVEVGGSLTRGGENLIGGVGALNDGVFLIGCPEIIRGLSIIFSSVVSGQSIIHS